MEKCLSFKFNVFGSHVGALYILNQDGRKLWRYVGHSKPNSNGTICTQIQYMYINQFNNMYVLADKLVNVVYMFLSLQIWPLQQQHGWTRGSHRT